jgi:repressor LexA
MKSLTEAQRRVYAFVSQAIMTQGFPPTRAEITRHFGWASGTAAQDHLTALEAKGYLKLVRGIARGIQLVRISEGARTGASRSA